MVITSLLAWTLFLVPVTSAIVFGRMAWRAHLELHGRRFSRFPLVRGRRMIGLVIALISLANIATGYGFTRLVGHEVGTDIVGGALLVRFALLLGAGYVQIRYRGT